MSSCFNSFVYSGHKFEHDQCSNVLSYEYSQFANKFTRDSLIELSNTCFDLYKHRLGNISPLIQNIGKKEFDIINKELISLILPFDPKKFSFSITEDPSLHFFVRFSKHVSLFVETYLDIETGNDTYLQILKSGHSIFEKNCMFDEAVLEIKDVLSSEFPHSQYNPLNISQVLHQCPPSL